MPQKYVVRNLKENAYYHAYNIGVENRDIFLDKKDYETFLYYLFIYTTPREVVRERYSDLAPRLAEKNLSEDIILVAYCLMPNHFHLLLKQNSARAIPKLMKQLINGYTTYFQKKYQKSGALLRGRYKSVVIESEYLVVQMVRFVHLNPSISGLVANPGDYVWSSYKHPLYINEVMRGFGSVEAWDKFHLDKNSYELNLPKIRHLVID